jgi:uncharacterized protein YceK
MKRFLALLAALMPGCSTVIYDGSGNKLAVIYSNATDVTLTKSGNGSVTFAAATIDNSTPTRAIARVAEIGIGAWGVAKALSSAPDTINAFTGNHP